MGLSMNPKHFHLHYHAKLKAYQVNLGYADDTNKLVVVKSFFVNNEKDAKHYILRWISSNE